MAINDKANIIASAAKVWVAPVGTAYPDETTVAAGANWVSWTNLGYTLEPVSLEMSQETFDLFVQQLSAPVRTQRTSVTPTITTTLAEVVGANLQYALDAALTTTAAGAGQKGFDEVKVSGENTDVSLWAVGIEGVRIHNTNAKLPVRMFFPRASIVMSGAMAFGKGAAVGIPITIKGFAADNGDVLVIHNVTAPAS